MSSIKHALVFLAAIPLAACTATIEPDDGEPSGSSMEPPDQTPSGLVCDGPEVLIPKRLVRLTFNQQVNALTALFGPELGETITTDFQIPTINSRTFPPLANPREGTVITGGQWQTSDNIAQEVGQYVLDNFAAVTACSDAPS